MRAPRLRTTPLPGVGVQYELTTRRQDTFSVIAHGDGSRTLRVHHEAAGLSTELTAAEALSLTDALLPAPDHPTLLHTTDFGLLTDRVTVTGRCHWNGRTLGETRLRTATGASVVAVLRRADTYPSPGPSFRLRGGDTVIVLGTQEGVREARRILEHG
ncbi:cation:proton antiporter regulatory subunit [Streptomyces sp. NPDC091377]|uniref:cation:proton antiporter regulatory subunit n=1 Tax=unclassified Streptomyces TaxID=2593676 RepID=UPI0038186BA4